MGKDMWLSYIGPACLTFFHSLERRTSESAASDHVNSKYIDTIINYSNRKGAYNIMQMILCDLRGTPSKVNGMINPCNRYEML